MSVIRWGIAGSGRAAGVVASEFVHVRHGEVVAIGSPELFHAKEIAKKYLLPKVYNSYEALIEDPEIDAIYIVAPNTFHFDIAMKAIVAKKAVLVEKPFAISAKAAKQLIQQARKLKVFAMESMWARFMPAIETVHEVIAWGRIGELTGIQADFWSLDKNNGNERVFAPSLGNGATLDLGSHLLSACDLFLGEASTIKAEGRLNIAGVDLSASYLVQYRSGATASLMCGFNSPGPNRMIVVGTLGWIEIEPPFQCPHTISVHRPGVLPRIIKVPAIGKGYMHELEEVTSCLREGISESMLMPLESTLRVAKLTDQVLKQLGVNYEEFGLAESEG